MSYTDPVYSAGDLLYGAGTPVPATTPDLAWDGTSMTLGSVVPGGTDGAGALWVDRLMLSVPPVAYGLGYSASIGAPDQAAGTTYLTFKRANNAANAVGYGFGGDNACGLSVAYNASFGGLGPSNTTSKNIGGSTSGSSRSIGGLSTNYDGITVGGQSHTGNRTKGAFGGQSFTQSGVDGAMQWGGINSVVGTGNALMPAGENSTYTGGASGFAYGLRATSSRTAAIAFSSGQISTSGDASGEWLTNMGQLGGGAGTYTVFTLVLINNDNLMFDIRVMRKSVANGAAWRTRGVVRKNGAGVTTLLASDGTGAPTIFTGTGNTNSLLLTVSSNNLLVQIASPGTNERFQVDVRLVKLNST